MKKCVVIGGGAAGLSAAAYLSKHGIKVTVYESAPKAGGRAYSFADQQSGDLIDNGQHILMGCYSDTLDFIKLINAEDNFIFNKRLKINFLLRGGRKVRLQAAKIFYPFNILIALLRYNALSISERISALKFMLRVPVASGKKLSTKSVHEWLIETNQSENILKSLWEIITVGSLNTNIKKASALLFKKVLQRIFFSGNFASTIVLPKYDLTTSYVDPAIKYIEGKGGKILLSSPIDELLIEGDKVTGIQTKTALITDFESVICTVPAYSAMSLLPQLFVDEDDVFEYSPILNVHLWLKENPLKEKFYGLIDSQVHWVFNKGAHLNFVISDAGYLIERTSEEIFDLCMSELSEYTSINKDDVTGYKIIKEKRATFVPSIQSQNKRPNSKTRYSNLFLAGDWTDTGLPSTIESAVKSGKTSAELVLRKLSSN